MGFGLPAALGAAVAYDGTDSGRPKKVPDLPRTVDETSLFFAFLLPCLFSWWPALEPELGTMPGV